VKRRRVFWSPTQPDETKRNLHHTKIKTWPKAEPPRGGRQNLGNFKEKTNKATKNQETRNDKPDINASSSSNSQEGAEYKTPSPSKT